MRDERSAMFEIDLCSGVAKVVSGERVESIPVDCETRQDYFDWVYRMLDKFYPGCVKITMPEGQQENAEYYYTVGAAIEYGCYVVLNNWRAR